MLEKSLQNCRFGYAGVSTCCQAHGALLDQLHAAGCTQIYREKVTRMRADRREPLKLLKALAAGDVVPVTRAWWRRAEGSPLKELAKGYNVRLATTSRLAR